MRKKIKGHQMAAVALCGLLLAAQGCGKTEETAPAAETAAEETAASEEGPVEAEETEAPQEETMEAEIQEETESPEPETIQSDETYPGTMAAAEEDSTFQYGVMYATVVDVQKEEDGSTLYSLQDSNDPENVWTLSSRDIGSISTEMEKGSAAAFLFSGDIIQDPENVYFIAAVPSAAYHLGMTEGVTESNMMSAFTVSTDSGETFTFIKDNCQIQEGAMSRSAGDRVRVYYAYSELEEIYYPLQVFAAE